LLPILTLITSGGSSMWTDFAPTADGRARSKEVAEEQKKTNDETLPGPLEPLMDTAGALGRGLGR
jgi:hypothetical protein